ncbi:MAG TPA: hypothetical protein DEQ47_08565 [Solibacterales bacterium]|nr:hypothetical protein [Bryobacterales bacterium]
MSFLDNLENTLKSLEGIEENSAEDRRRQDAESARVAAVAPWAGRLKQSTYVRDLMSLATRAGYQQRAKVNLTWIGTTLRLELRRDRLELRPQSHGVLAVFLRDGQELGSRSLDLSEAPQELVTAWLAVMEPTG